MQNTSHGTTLHMEGTSPLHGLHPFNKLAYVLLAATIVYLAPGGMIPDAVLLGCNFLAAMYCGIFRSTWKASWRFLLPLAIFMVPIHGFLYPGNATALYSYHGFTLYREGLLFAATILLQLSVLLTASLLFVFTTHPADFITALTDAGCPPTLAYLFGSPMLMLPAMKARIGVIQAAQRARGLDSEGSLRQRIRALPALVTPFVLGALTEIEHRAVALETRGFKAPGPRTALRTVADSMLQKTFRRTMLIGAFGLICYHFLR